MNKEYKLMEFFSGIGSQYRALKNIGLNIEVVGTSEWDIHALVAYDIIHNGGCIPKEYKALNKEMLLKELEKYTFSTSGKEPMKKRTLYSYSEDVLRRIFLSVIRNNNFVDINNVQGKNLPNNIDILTYSFPCQDLSNVGIFHGYNKGIDKDSGSRSSLLWQVGRVLSEMKKCKKTMPKFLLMENVPTLLSKRHMHNFELWINDLCKLGYVSKYYRVNATSFGLPQNRPRLIMISVYVGNNKEKKKKIEDFFLKTETLDIVNDFKKTHCYHKYKISDLLRIDYSNSVLKQEAIDSTPNNTPSRKKIWLKNPQIVLKNNVINEKYKSIRTITTKQDRHPNSGNIYFESGVKGKSKFRFLTPRECLLFMGYKDSDYEVLMKNNIIINKKTKLFLRDNIIKMAGNSIPVKMLEGIFSQIIKIESILD